MGQIGIWQIVIVVLLLVLLFGRGKISELMGDVAQGIKSFKKGISDEEKTATESPDLKTIDHNATDAVNTAGKTSSTSKTANN